MKYLYLIPKVIIIFLINHTAQAENSALVVGADCSGSACLEAYLSPLLETNSALESRQVGLTKSSKKRHRNKFKEKLKNALKYKYEMGYGMELGIHPYVKGFDKRGKDIGISRSLSDDSSLSFNLRKPGINWIKDNKSYKLNFRLSADDDSKEKAQLLFGISSDW
jgi:hypothetical protein